MRVEGAAWCGAEPTIVVNAVRRGPVGKRPLHRADFGRPGPSNLDGADEPFLEQTAGLLRDRAGAHLAPLLDDAAVLPGRGDDQWPFGVDVRNRLLDIDVFVRLHRAQRDGGVPV